MNLCFFKKNRARIKHIVCHPDNYKYLCFDKNVKPNGIVIVIHESNRLGASLLALNTAKELINQGENVYIISRQFGELNDEYSLIAPTQVIFSTKAFNKTLRKLKEAYNYRRIIMITAAVGDLTKVAYNLDYNIVSEIHELPSVIKALDLERSTKIMLNYSSKIIFPTNTSKNEILELIGFPNKENMYVKPQGTYFKKPKMDVIRLKKKVIINKYPKLLKKKVIIGVGNTSERKGFDIFVNVAFNYPDAIFVWAGKKEAFYNKVMKNYNNKANNFQYIGELNSNALAGLYSIADVLLLSSRSDTLPSVIFEALLFNVPVIGSIKSGGIGDVIKNKKNGVLIKDSSVKEYVKAIKFIFQSDCYNTMLSYMRTKKIKNSFSHYISFILNLLNQRLD